MINMSYVCDRKYVCYKSHLYVTQVKGYKIVSKKIKFVLITCFMSFI